MNTNRRKFLKLASLSTFALTSGVSTLSLTADPVHAKLAPGNYGDADVALHAKRWAMVIDTRRFRSEEDYQPLIKACHRAHNVPDIPNEKNIKWFWLDSFDHVFPDDMNPHLSQHLKNTSFPLLCNHCTNPPCVRVCPTQATYKMADGIVAMDYHRCIGCRFCMAGCPYGARSFNFYDPRKYLPTPTNPKFPTRMIGVVEKCTFCSERLAQGKLPACVEASEGKILFGDLEDPNSSVRRALAENYSIRRKPNLGTQPGVYYLI
ncbi:MAG: 4Fe-4S dicluster domain-containing protein [Desulfovibrio sp.]|nr:4Fe-4S dicluster domain-containing protein [Desulfovibrio sp.]